MDRLDPVFPPYLCRLSHRSCLRLGLCPRVTGRRLFPHRFRPDDGQPVLLLLASLARPRVLRRHWHRVHLRQWVGDSVHVLQHETGHGYWYCSSWKQHRRVSLTLLLPRTISVCACTDTTKECSTPSSSPNCKPTSASLGRPASSPSSPSSPSQSPTSSYASASSLQPAANSSTGPPGKNPPTSSST